MDVDSQIKNLKDLGLCINDVEFAKSVLNEVSYFRLIKAYSLQLKEKNSNFHSGISFEQILNLYRFNKRLRNLLYPLIEDIEIAFRCRISNFFGMKYGVTGYFDSNNFVDPNYHQEIIDEINNCIFRGGRAACPAWREPRVRTRRSHPFGTNVIQMLLSHRPLASTCRVLHQWP